MLDFLFNRYVVLIIGLLVMVVGLMPEYTLKAVRMIGMMGWAESSIGRGGTFAVWKIIGLVAPIIAIVYFFTPSLHISLSNKPAQQTNQYQQNQYDDGFDSFDPTDSYYN